MANKMCVYSILYIVYILKTESWRCKIISLIEHISEASFGRTKMSKQLMNKQQKIVIKNSRNFIIIITVIEIAINESMDRLCYIK